MRYNDILLKVSGYRPPRCSWINDPGPSVCSEQASLKQRLVEGDTEEWQTAPGFEGLERVGGVDLSYIKGDDVNACAQLVVLSFPELEVEGCVFSSTLFPSPNSSKRAEMQFGSCCVEAGFLF